MHNFRFNVYFHNTGEGVGKNIICLCTISKENLFTCKISSLVLLRLLSYASS